MAPLSFVWMLVGVPNLLMLQLPDSQVSLLADVCHVPQATRHQQVLKHHQNHA